MATYNRPGVYINELPLAASPLNGALAATAAGAVIGAFPQGPTDVTPVTSWYDFTKKFGGLSAAYPSTYAVNSFFTNGGTSLFVKRVLPITARKVAKVSLPSAAVSSSYSATKYSIVGNVAVVTTPTTTITAAIAPITLTSFADTTLNGAYYTSATTPTQVTFPVTHASTAATTGAAAITAVAASSPSTGSATYTYTLTTGATPFVVGQYVNVTSMGTAGYNTTVPTLISAASTVSPYTFTIANATTGASTYVGATANTVGTAPITAVSGTGTFMTYTATNAFVVGQTVTVTGIAVNTGYNVTNAVITSVVAGVSFTVAGSVTATGSTFTGAYATANSAVVTAASAASGVVTYTAANSFVAGQVVSITGMPTASAAFNLINVVVGANPTSSTFTVTNNATAPAVTGALGQATTNENIVTVGTLSTAVSSNPAYATFAAKHRGIDGNSVRVMIAQSKVVRDPAYYDVSVYFDTSPADTTVNNMVTANSSGDTLVEQFNGVVFNDTTSVNYIASVLEFGSAYVRVLSAASTSATGAIEYDANGVVITPQVTYPVAGVTIPTPTTAVGTPYLNTLFALSGAPTATVALTYADYTGNVYVGTTSPTTGYDPYAGNGSFVVTDCTIFSEFEAIDQPLVFFLPDVVGLVSNTSSATSGAGWARAKDVYNALIAWVEKPATAMRHFVIVETDYNLSPDIAIGNFQQLTATSRAAAYYPHVYVKDVNGYSASAVRRIGPSGSVAGIYLNTDRMAGPFKSPAGLDASIVDAVALERAFSPTELDALNTGITTLGVGAGFKTAVNAIRNIPGAGVVVMGARTLLQDNTANRYVNMRRSLTYLEKRLNDLVAPFVFQNNTERLWGSIITVVGTFLNDYRNQGGLRGSTVAEAFYVKCDGDNNTPLTIAAGEVHIEVGVALEYPAEFVVINLSQKSI